MIAKPPEEGAHGGPTDQQLRVGDVVGAGAIGEVVGGSGRCGKAANVRTCQGLAGQTEVHDLRNQDREEIPVRRRVAGPCGGVALHAGVAATGDDEGTLVDAALLAQFDQAFISCANQVEREHIVNARMRRHPVSSEVVDQKVEGQGLPRHGGGNTGLGGRIGHVLPDHFESGIE